MKTSREILSDVSLNSSSSELFTSLKLVHIPKDKKGELSRDLVHKRWQHYLQTRFPSRCTQIIKCISHNITRYAQSRTRSIAGMVGIEVFLLQEQRLRLVQATKRAHIMAVVNGQHECSSPHELSLISEKSPEPCKVLETINSQLGFQSV